MRSFNTVTTSMSGKAWQDLDRKKKGRPEAALPWNRDCGNYLVIRLTLSRTKEVWRLLSSVPLK